MKIHQKQPGSIVHVARYRIVIQAQLDRQTAAFR